jgi:hypothetical protein
MWSDVVVVDGAPEALELLATSDKAMSEVTRAVIELHVVEQHEFRDFDLRSVVEHRISPGESDQRRVIAVYEHGEITRAHRLAGGNEFLSYTRRSGHELEEVREARLLGADSIRGKDAWVIWYFSFNYLNDRCGPIWRTEWIDMQTLRLLRQVRHRCESSPEFPSSVTVDFAYPD